jgi:hypothetical protein
VPSFYLPASQVEATYAAITEQDIELAVQITRAHSNEFADQAFANVELLSVELNLAASPDPAHVVSRVIFHRR